MNHGPGALTRHFKADPDRAEVINVQLRTLQIILRHLCHVTVEYTCVDFGVADQPSGGSASWRRWGEAGVKIYFHRHGSWRSLSQRRGRDHQAHGQTTMTLSPALTLKRLHFQTYTPKSFSSPISFWLKDPEPSWNSSLRFRLLCADISHCLSL